MWAVYDRRQYGIGICGQYVTEVSMVWLMWAVYDRGQYGVVVYVGCI